MPAPTRLESALAAARADVTLAEVAIERSRIRTPIDGTVLQVNSKVGEMLAPSPENIAVTLGDLSALRVRAEVEERDIAKMRIGQRVVVRAPAYSGQEFEGKVTRVAEVLAPPRLGSGSGPRKPNDIDVLEVMIDLDGQPPLLPGMRVDVFFKTDATAQSSEPAPVR
jgi:HlyD family secretion protein